MKENIVLLLLNLDRFSVRVRFLGLMRISVVLFATKDPLKAAQIPMFLIGGAEKAAG